MLQKAKRIKARSRRMIRTRLKRRDGNNCWICLQPMLNGDVTIDHIVPKGVGGSNEDSNLKLAHRFCNESRTWSAKTCIKMASLTPKQRRKKFGYG